MEQTQAVQIVISILVKYAMDFFRKLFPQIDGKAVHVGVAVLAAVAMVVQTLVQQEIGGAHLPQVLSVLQAILMALGYNEITKSKKRTKKPANVAKKAPSKKPYLD